MTHPTAHSDTRSVAKNPSAIKAEGVVAASVHALKDGAMMLNLRTASGLRHFFVPAGPASIFAVTNPAPACAHRGGKRDNQHTRSAELIAKLEHAIALKREGALTWIQAAATAGVTPAQAMNYDFKLRRQASPAPGAPITKPSGNLL